MWFDLEAFSTTWITDFGRGGGGGGGAGREPNQHLHRISIVFSLLKYLETLFAEEFLPKYAHAWVSLVPVEVTTFETAVPSFSDGVCTATMKDTTIVEGSYLTWKKINKTFN